MNILLICLIIIFIVLVIRLFIINIKEGFTNISPEIMINYKKFVEFYNPFMENWQKAIITSIVADIPQEPLSDSNRHISTDTKKPSHEQMNAYITQLSQKIDKSLPLVTDALPTDINTKSLLEIVNRLPADTTIYNNALSWMNTQLEHSHSSLGQALQGVFPPSNEGFYNMSEDTCQDISQCLSNPDFVKQLAQQLARTQEKDEAQQETIANDKLQLFNKDTILQAAATLNTQLVKKSEDIQQKAESGELYSQMNIPGITNLPKTYYQIPEGGDRLANLERTDPQKYNDLKTNYDQWFSVKQLFEQINANL